MQKDRKDKGGRMVSKKSKIKISKMSGKLEGLGAINTNPLTNKWCMRKANKNSICNECYSKKMLKAFRKNCVPAFNSNSKLLSTTLLFEKDLPKKIKYTLMRFNAHGELINFLHLLNLVKICNTYPDKTFSLFTKQPKYINQYVKKNCPLPTNLVLVYSTDTLNCEKPVVPKHFHKCFSVYTEEWLATHKKVKINCGAKSCKECRLCYSFNRTKFVSEKIK